MGLEFKALSKKDGSYKKAIDIYKEAFPRNERTPLLFLNRRVKQNKANFMGIFDNTIQIGIIYYVINNDILYVFYFAIDNKYRSKGYGSKTLDHLKKTYPNKRIFLEIEEVDEKYEDYTIRNKRLIFYKRSGLYDSNLKMRQFGDVYQILMYGAIIKKNELKKFYKNYFGPFFYLMFLPKIIEK